MSDDPEYEYRLATVRLRKGEKLAASKETPGWGRGFTPKTSDKNPEHVEILLHDETEDLQSDFDIQDDETYEQQVAENEEERGEVELSELLGAAALAAILVGAHVTGPYIKRWWMSKALPFVQGRGEAIKRWQNSRNTRRGAIPERTKTNSTTLDPDDNDAVSTALAAYEADMSSAEARRHLVELLVAQHFVKQKQLLLASVRVYDDDLPAELEHTIQELSAEQIEEMLNSLLTDPAFIGDLQKCLHGRDHSELSQSQDDNFRTFLELTVHRENSRKED